MSWTRSGPATACRGFAYGLLQGWAPRACARAGNLIAAYALRGTGDWETFPYIEDVRSDLTP
jgi:sugar/nucleoside kinase (ribokinase family)